MRRLVYSLKFQRNQLKSLNHSDVLPCVNQVVLSQLSKIEVLKLNCRLKYLTGFFIEKSAIHEHSFNILSPISDIHVLTLLNLFFDSC